MGNDCEKQTVVAVSLDWFAEKLAPPAVVKCDVEGAEIEGIFWPKNPETHPTVLLIEVCSFIFRPYHFVPRWTAWRHIQSGNLSTG
jgi:hypothetical protein